MRSSAATRRSTRRSLALLAAAGLIGTMLLRRVWPNALFLARLAYAKHIANRFYDTCQTVTKNVAVHAALSTRLDVYQPSDARGCPVLIYVYGGSWNSGNRRLYAPIAQRLLPEGVVVVLPDYSAYPHASFPRPTQEIAAAIAWTLDNIQNYGGDPRRVYIAAQSAGAQVAALAVLDPQYLAVHGHSPAAICGFAGISGVFDMPAQLAHVGLMGPGARYVTAVAGGAHNLLAASPSRHVHPKAPPFLLIHGDADTTVPLSISIDFHNRLRAAGVPSELIVYAGGGHSGLLFDALVKQPPRLLRDLMRFVRTGEGECFEAGQPGPAN